jgi:hypothetical protein
MLLENKTKNDNQQFFLSLNELVRVLFSCIEE